MYDVVVLYDRPTGPAAVADLATLAQAGVQVLNVPRTLTWR